MSRSAGRGSAPDIAAWLETLPLAGVALVDRLDQPALEQTDVLWLRDDAAVPGDGATAPPLLAWLQAGGRLLATHTAARLPALLGLGAPPPTRLSSPEDVAQLGLAAFGSHPCFAGLGDGPLVGQPASGDDLWGYAEGRRPRAAGAVAMARHGLSPDPMTLLVWELEVGQGGVLCLAFEPAVAAPERPGEGGVLLANALVGEAIPHRDRAVPAVVWPVAGRQAVPDASPMPADAAVVAPSDPWPSGTEPRMDLTPVTPWVHAGRRATVTAGDGGGRDVWMLPFRTMHNATVRGAIACAPGHLAADEVTGGLALGGIRLLERWLAAADVPVVVWELTGPAGVELSAEWTVDLQRAWPYPAGSYGDLRFRLGDDGATLRVEASGGRAACFAVLGGRLEATGSADAPVVQVVCRGVTPLRIVVAAGLGQAEIARAAQVLARDGVAGLATARGRRADQLRRSGTGFESPDPLLGLGYDWARQRGDEALVGVPGVGRSVLTGCPGRPGAHEWCFGSAAGPAAAALLAAGHRDPARELLKFLAQAARPDGGIPAHLPLGGLASAPDVAATVEFVALAARLLAWTGDEAAFQAVAPAIRGALVWLRGAGAAPPMWVLETLDAVVDGEVAGLIAELRPLAPPEPLSTPGEPHAIVQAAAAALRRAPGALEAGGAATALLEAATRLWGLEPDAVAGTLAVRPILPDWDRFALRRLRVGRTLLDLELRRRAAAVTVRAVHRFGASLVLTVELPGATIETIELDDEPLAGGRARFELRGRHEVRFQLR